jgi:hypothetical protein
VPEQAQVVEPLLARELRPVPARDDDVDPLARAAGTSAPTFLRAVCEATQSTYGRSSAWARRAGSGSAAGVKRSSTPPAITAASTPSRSASSARAKSETVINRQARRATAGSTSRCHAA